MASEEGKLYIIQKVGLTQYRGLFVGRGSSGVLDLLNMP
jgi:hypothetical protein